jgi:cobalamin biosynthetic protein CobC
MDQPTDPHRPPGDHAPSVPPGQPRHGGDLAWAGRRYGEPPGGWLDLSTGVNPVPYPPPPAPLNDLARLPGRDDLAALIDAARRAYGIPVRAAVVATPGTEIALRLLPMIAGDGAAAVESPTYPSHAEAWSVAGHRVVSFPSIDAVPPDVAFVVVGNPNNPDGRTAAPLALADLAQRLGVSGGFLAVDEAFADVAPDLSLIPDLGALPAVALRSFGKFYGLPGLRLGFVVGPPGIVQRFDALLGDWPVSGTAITVARAALADDGWRDSTRERLRRDVGGLRELLDGHGLAVVGGTDLFTLVAAPKATEIHRRLAERGVWTRAFHDHQTWLRFGTPTAGGLTRLAAALASIR